MRLTITGEIDNPDQRICQAQRGGGVEGCKGVVKDWPKDPVHIQKLWWICQLQGCHYGTGFSVQRRSKIVTTVIMTIWRCHEVGLTWIWHDQKEKHPDTKQLWFWTWPLDLGAGSKDTVAWHGTACCMWRESMETGWLGGADFRSILIIGVWFVRCRQQDVQDFVAIAVHLVQDVVRTENFGRENWWSTINLNHPSVHKKVYHEVSVRFKVFCSNGVPPKKSVRDFFG